MRRKEIWEMDGVERYPLLRGRRKADVAVVGGGFTGITTALWLARAGLKVMVLEAETLGCGASSRCGGIVTLCDRLLLERLAHQQGKAAANAYIHTQMDALAAIRTLAGEETADFGWLDADAYLVSPKEKDSLAGEIEAMLSAGMTVQSVEAPHSPMQATSAIQLNDMAVLHPAKYLRFLASRASAQGVRIFEHSRVTALETNLVQTARGSVLAPYVVIATGYPIINIPGWYFLRLNQRRRCLVSLPAQAPFEGVILDAGGAYALRNYQEGILLQMDAGLVGEKRKADALRHYEQRYAPFFNDRPPRTLLQGVETFSADGLPYIGSYSSKTPNLFVAAGYGGRGLLGSMTAAQAISARVLGLKEDDYYVLSGQRNSPATRRKELVTAAGMAGRYARNFFHFRAPRCPHMGCKLVYARRERIWECPCHGSCFDDIGHVLNAPAIDDTPIRRWR
ncbi:MAG: FAD-dependent oxidoreductase [Clostridiales bacterium]|nr:FAD-dependent oxidoreductase [Clostridiales bacterium]